MEKRGRHGSGTTPLNSPTHLTWLRHRIVEPSDEDVYDELLKSSYKQPNQTTKIDIKSKSQNSSRPFSMQRSQNMYLNPSDDRTITRFSSADSFLVWWKSSHSSPNQSRSPSPNLQNTSASRSRSLSPIFPSTGRLLSLPSKMTLTPLNDRFKPNSSTNKKDKLLSSSFSNFLRQRLGSKHKKIDSKIENFSKPSRSISLENLSLVPIEVRSSPVPSARRMFMMDRQMSSKKKWNRSIDDSFIDIPSIPLTLYHIENGRFSASAVFNRAPKNVHKIIIEVRGFVIDVEFSTQSTKKPRKPTGSFRILSPESKRSCAGKTSCAQFVDSKTRKIKSSKDCEPLLKDEFRSPIIIDHSIVSISSVETRHFKLNLPIFADTSTLFFDWNQTTKSLLVTGAVKGCSHISGSQINSRQRMTSPNDFLLTLSCCNMADDNNG